MNTNTSGYTHGGQHGAGEPAYSVENPYHTQAQAQPAQAQLDGAAPQLKSNDMQRMNRSAMIMLVVLALLLIVGVLWMFLSPGSSKSAATKPNEETVNIPEAPKVPSPPTMPTPVPAPRAAPTQPIPLAPSSSPSAQVRPAQEPQPHAPTLMERRMASANAESTPPPMGATEQDNGAQNIPMFPGTGIGLDGMDAESRAAAAMASPYYLPSNSAYTNKLESTTKPTNAQPLTHPDNLMLRGTYIRCVLESRIITDIPGYTSCIVTEPVYSFTGKQLLLPKGSKVLGSYSQEPNGPRVAVVWDRVVTPTGVDIGMSSPGVDNLGGAGHPGNYNAHWISRISSALFISMLSDAFKYEAAKKGPTTSTIAADGTIVQQPFDSNTARTIQDIANQAVRKSANRPATVTINQGTVVTIYVSKDVDFSGVIARR